MLFLTPSEVQALAEAMPPWAYTLLSLSIEPSLHIVKERLDHEDIGTTVNIYGHMLPSVDEALAARLDNLHATPAPARNVTDLRPAGNAS